MKTPNQIVSDLYKLINVPTVKAEITGDVYKVRRGTAKSGESKQDIVIISLADLAGQLQEGYINVNIHVPDNYILVNGIKQYELDNLSMDRISDVVIPLINDVYTEGVLFWIEKLTTFDEPELNEHYLNLKVRFGHPNL